MDGFCEAARIISLTPPPEEFVGLGRCLSFHRCYQHILGGFDIVLTFDHALHGQLAPLALLCWPCTLLCAFNTADRAASRLRVCTDSQMPTASISLKSANARDP